MQTRELSPFLKLHHEMNRLFDDVFRDFDWFRSGTRNEWPQIEISETDDGYRLTAELPGIDEKDVELSMQDGVLTLRGEKRAETTGPGRSFSERYYGAFERRIPLGDVDEDKVKASFDKGVLTVTLPRSPQAQARIKRIPIGGETRH